MRVVVTANGGGVDAPFVPVFGRCPSFVFVDTETLTCETLPNDGVGAAGGAGIQAAQSVVAKGARAVITGHVGPNAYRVLAAAGVPVYLFDGGTVREAALAYRTGRLKPASAPTGPAHAGLGTMGGPGRGLGLRGGHSWGPGGSRPTGPAPQGGQPASPRPDPQAELQELRTRLQELEARIDELESR